MTIEYKDSKRIVGLSTDTVGLSFEDDYTSNTGWTQTGSKVTVDSGKSDWVDANAAATNDSLQQVIKSLGITLSDTAWTADFTYINNGGTVGGYPFVFQSGTGNYDSASNDAITMSEDNPNKIKINTKNGGSYVAGSSTIAVSSGTTYYIRIQRTSATDIKLSAFTDSARTTHTSGSPVTASNAGIANITGLTYVQHQNQTTGGGGTSNFEITDLKIYNNLTSIESKPTDVQDNSIMVEKDTGRRYWFTSGAFSSISGLTAYYNFEETTGTMTNQASAVGSPDQITADGTFESYGGSSPSRTSAGKIGTYSTFFSGTADGTGSRYNLSGNPMPSASNADFTVSLWLKGGRSSATNTLLGCYPNGSDWQITWNPGVSINFYLGSNTQWAYSFSTSDWVHIVVQRDSGTYKLYWNGTFKAISSGSSGTGALTGNPSIGSDPGSGSNREVMGGNIDDMSIWNRVLTPAEIAILYNGGTGRAVSKSSWTYPPTYTGNYSSTSGWTQATTNTANSGTGSQTVGIDGGWAYANSTGSANGQFVHTSLGITLNDTKWVADFEYYNIGAVNMYPFVLAAGTSSSWDSTQDMVSVVEAGTNVLMIRYRDGSSQANSSASSTMSTNTSYFCRLIRDGQVLTLKMYTDSARTSQHGSDITVTISGSVTGLTTLHHSGITGGGATSGYNFKVRGTEIYNGVTSV